MSQKAITINTLTRMKAEGEKITCLTAYDASFAKLLSETGIEVLLVGDSLGMVVKGQGTTVPVQIEDMVYHTKAVARGNQGSLLIADMPFLSYSNPDKAVETAGWLMQDGGAHMVKLEGGETRLEAVRAIADEGIPVCGHLGLLPQSIFKLGSYRVQGREKEDAHQLLLDAVALQEAGASMLVLECVPSLLAAEITKSLKIPTIGIGAGVDCDGQVLVLYDILGMVGQHRPRFVKDFLQGNDSLAGAVQTYIDAVKNKTFPGPEHSFE